MIDIENFQMNLKTKIKDSIFKWSIFELEKLDIFDEIYSKRTACEILLPNYYWNPNYSSVVKLFKC